MSPLTMLVNMKIQEAKRTCKSYIFILVMDKPVSQQQHYWTVLRFNTYIKLLSS